MRLKIINKTTTTAAKTTITKMKKNAHIYFFHATALRAIFVSTYTMCFWTVDKYVFVKCDAGKIAQYHYVSKVLT